MHRADAEAGGKTPFLKKKKTVRGTTPLDIDRFHASLTHER